MNNTYIKSGGADEPKTQYTADERNDVICMMTEDEVKETFLFGLANCVRISVRSAPFLTPRPIISKYYTNNAFIVRGRRAPSLGGTRLEVCHASSVDTLNVFTAAGKHAA